MKKLCGLLILLNVLAFVVFSQSQMRKVKPTNAARKVKPTVVTRMPSEATVVVDLLDLPGKNDEKSNWEFTYELRIIDQESFNEAAKQGKLKQMAIDDEKSGNLIGKNFFKKENLAAPENRRVVLRIPFNEASLKKLNTTQSSKPVYLFYGTALVFDAKLKKNIFVPLSWIWRSEVYPDAKFGMEFSIEESKGDDGYSYSRRTLVPEKLPKDFFETGSPTSKP